MNIITTYFWSAAFVLVSSSFIQAQNVNIPDANFKAELVGNLAINTNMDTEIQVSEAQAFSGTMDVSYKNITSLVGIEAFTSLTQLNCRNNQLTTLNVSLNTTLVHLYCNNNQLTILDVSANTALEYLWCYTNQLTALNISTNTGLIHLYCNNNQITTLDVSLNTALTILACSQNQLTTLDVSTNIALQSLDCFVNQLTALNIGANTGLTYLSCRNNQLTTLDLSTYTLLSTLYCGYNQLTALDVSTNIALQSLNCTNNQLTVLNLSVNTALIELYCQFNQLTTLDLHTNTALTVLQCSSNQLSSLNIKNGNNTNMINSYFTALANPNLTCIQVDNAAYSTTNWPNKPSTATYSTVCATSISNINNILPNLTAYPNPTTSNITLQLGEFQEQVTLSVINTMGQIILERAYNSTPQIDLELEGAAGIYFVRLQTAKGEMMLKVVKE